MTARADLLPHPDAAGAGTSPGADGSGVPPCAAPPALHTLTRRTDFLAAAKGRRTGTPGAGLQARWRGAGGGTAIRVGITCSRKVGNAVARNRAKRRLREIARRVLPRAGLPGWDYVLIGRAGETAQRDFARMAREVESALARLHRGATGAAPR